MLQVYEYHTITIGYFKNHLTKHRLVCTHSHAFSMLIPNIDTMCNIFFFYLFVYLFLRFLIVNGRIERVRLCSIQQYIEDFPSLVKLQDQNSNLWNHLRDSWKLTLFILWYNLWLWMLFFCEKQTIKIRSEYVVYNVDKITSMMDEWCQRLCHRVFLNTPC